MKQPFGSLLISSPQGHSGKTTVTLGICYALRQRGLSIQPFKKGPDYIDPSWLTVAAGRPCRNLDPFLIPREKLITLFQETSREADMAIVEGVMGLYDGLDSHGTTAEIARLLNIPVLLVINTNRMTSSIAAMVTGYQQFQKDIRIAGVILNFVNGSRHEMKLRSAIERYCGIPVLGSLPKDDSLRITERHLGLIPSIESGNAESIIERITSQCMPYFDVDRILKIARSNGDTQSSAQAGSSRKLKAQSKTLCSVTKPCPEIPAQPPRPASKARIGVVCDCAFNFYYPENLEALTREGAELVTIDSFKDRLPEIDGLYIGGGFPEFFLQELENNRQLRNDIVLGVERGLPVYAECAGLMYLCQSISWREKSYEMVGILPSRIELSNKPQGHGYAVVEVDAENPLFPRGMMIRAHEFHHSRLLDSKALSFAYRMTRGHGVNGKRDGVIYKNLFASYIHIHALGVPEWAKNFVSLASRTRHQTSDSRHQTKTSQHVMSCELTG